MKRRLRVTCQPLHICRVVVVAQRTLSRGLVGRGRLDHLPHLVPDSVKQLDRVYRAYPITKGDDRAVMHVVRCDHSEVFGSHAGEIICY